MNRLAICQFDLFWYYNCNVYSGVSHSNTNMKSCSYLYPWWLHLPQPGNVYDEPK
jgi:hypothetical protein